MSDIEKPGLSTLVAPSVVADSTANNASTDSFITTEEKERIESSLNDMSEQLMDSMNKNQILESKIISLQEKLTNYDVSKQKELNDLKATVANEVKLRESADFEAKKLREEISELSASLFEEANKMVAVERENSFKKDLEIKKVNLKLKEKEELEKDLTDQLSSLKDILQDVTENPTEEEVNTMSKTTSVNTSKNGIADSNNKILFSPFMKNIRFDTEFYQEFLKFLAILPFSKDIYDTKTDSKLIKKIISNDVEPVLRLESSKSLAWTHKKNLILWLISGEVLVEPISGLNGTFNSNHSTDFKKKTPLDSNLFKFPMNSPPVAVPDACSICNETRTDTLEHNRLYYMKLPSQSNKRSYHSYPLCHYCLLKIRSIGDIFSLLREVKMGVWKLEEVSLIKQNNLEKSTAITEAPKIERDSNGKRKRSLSRAVKRSSMISDAFNMFTVPQASFEPSVKVDIKNLEPMEDNANNLNFTNIQLCYLELSKLRNKLYWANLGIWSLDSDSEDQYCLTSDIKPHEDSKLNKNNYEKHTLALLSSGVSSDISIEKTGEKAGAREVKDQENRMKTNGEANSMITTGQQSHEEMPLSTNLNLLNSKIEEEEENTYSDSGFEFEAKNSQEDQIEAKNSQEDQIEAKNSQEDQIEAKNSQDDQSNVKEEDEGIETTGKKPQTEVAMSPALTTASEESNGVFFDSYQDDTSNAE